MLDPPPATLAKLPSPVWPSAIEQRLPMRRTANTVRPKVLRFFIERPPNRFLISTAGEQGAGIEKPAAAIWLILVSLSKLAKVCSKQRSTCQDFRRYMKHL